jgi:thiol-disulfide isomerase/thioredoxin
VFWATWCKYCVEEIPSLNVLQKDMGDEVKILAVSDEPDSTVKDFIDGRKIGYTVAIASAGFESMGTIYPIPASQGRPAAMHIGKDGVVKIVYIGSPSLTELKQIVKSK